MATNSFPPEASEPNLPENPLGAPDFDDKVIHQPTVVVPDRLFLIGCLYGFNAGRRTAAKDPGKLEPVYSGPSNPEDKNSPSSLHDAKPADPFISDWFQVECIKCTHIFAYDSPNEIPKDHLVCPTCGNIVIYYGSTNPEEWHIGPIRLI
jgi:ribosomal protein S27E